MSNVDTELLVRHHSECKDLLIEALKYHLMPEQRGVLSNSRTRPRRCEGASPVLFAVGQCAAEGTHEGTFTDLTDCNVHNCHHGRKIMCFLKFKFVFLQYGRTLNILSWFQYKTLIQFTFTIIILGA